MLDCCGVLAPGCGRFFLILLWGICYTMCMLYFVEQSVSREFAEIRRGRLFRLNGNDYVKQSSRTARMLSTGRIYYIGKREVVHPIAW